MESRKSGTLSARLFYGWIIVVAAFFAFGMVYGTVIYSYSVFVNPIATAFHATPTSVVFGFTLMNIGTGIFGIYAGRLLARHRVRYGMIGGLVLLAAGFFLLSLSVSLWQFYAVYCLVIPLGAVIVAPLGASAIITNWFIVSRGRALTLATLGTSFGQLIIPRLAAAAIEAWGWQGAYRMFTVLLIVIAVPIIALLVVDRPEDKQLMPYGVGLLPPSATDISPLLTARQVLVRGDFWSIGISYTLTVTVYLALVATMVPYARTFGVSAVGASALVVCMGIFAIIGKLAFAVWTDRLGLRNTFWIAVALNLAATILLVAMPQYYVLFIASACIGASAGGILPLWPGLVAFRFGRGALPSVMGLMSPVILSIQGFGAPFATATNYRPAFMTFIALLLVSLLVSRNLHRPPVQVPLKG